MSEIEGTLRGLNVLCIDNAGPGGLSTLLLVAEIMRRMEEMTGSGTLLPCEHFDIIAGIGTGAIQACLLGRLQLSTGQAIQAYKSLFEEVYGESRINRIRLNFALGTQPKLQHAIFRMVLHASGDSSAPMLGEQNCKVMAFAMSQRNAYAGKPTIFRSYPDHTSSSADYTIWEALCATMTYLQMFNKERQVVESFTAHVHGYNNPLAHVLSELKALHPTRHIASIVSIGVEYPRTILQTLQSGFQRLLATPLEFAGVEMMTADSEWVSDRVAEQFRGMPDLYFRFSVQHTFLESRVSPWTQFNEIAGATQEYSYKAEIKDRLDTASRAIKLRKSVVTTQNAGQIQVEVVNPPPLNRGQTHRMSQNSGPVPEDRITLISSTTSVDKIVTILGSHGCKNLSCRLNLRSFGDIPVCSGGLGDIYKGDMVDGMRVAIKTTRLYLVEQDESYLKHVAKELYTWSKCRHPNVVSLLGLVAFRGQIGMVSRWWDNGNVRKYLLTRPEIDRCQLCCNISEGLIYLHKIGIVHGDLKGANILMSDDGAPMLTDFGNAVLQEQSLNFTESTTRSNISPRWTAPEILAGLSSCSFAADIYALGMTWLEIFTDKIPFSELKKDTALYYPIVNEKKVPQRPDQHIPRDSRDGNALWALLIKCWAYAPEERPSAREVSDLMRNITRDGLICPTTEPPSEVEA